VANKIVAVADDEFYIVRALSVLFDRLGYDCVTARDGEAAVELVKREHPAILFLDLDMPKKNGYDVLREIRANPAYDDVHIVLLTAKGVDPEDDFAARLGADDCVLKPFDPQDVQRRVVDVLSRIPDPPETAEARPSF